MAIDSLATHGAKASAAVVLLASYPRLFQDQVLNGQTRFLVYPNYIMYFRVKKPSNSDIIRVITQSRKFYNIYLGKIIASDCCSIHVALV